MGKNPTKDAEEEIYDTLSKFQAEAITNLTNAFNEGYLLGRKYGETVYGKGGSDEQN